MFNVGIWGKEGWFEIWEKEGYLLGRLGLVLSIALDGSSTTHVVLLQCLPLDRGRVSWSRDGHGGEEHGEEDDEEVRTHCRLVSGTKGTRYKRGSKEVRRGPRRRKGVRRKRARAKRTGLFH